MNGWQILWAGLRIGLAIYLGLILVLFIFQARYVYFPSRPLLATPATVGLAFEEVSLSSDQQRLAAWWVPAPAARGTVLICHGNGGNIGDRLHAVQLFHQLGMNVCIFDYRGYGKSTGRPSEAGTYADALAAWHFLTQTRQLAPEQIIIVGRSLGGAVAAWLAQQHRPAGLILEASFTSLPDVAARFYPYLPVRWLCRYRYPTRDYLSRVRCPVLVAHSRSDELIPYAQGEALWAAAPEPKTFVELSGWHNDGEISSPAAYIQALDEFLGQHLPQRTAEPAARAD